MWKASWYEYASSQLRNQLIPHPTQHFALRASQPGIPVSVSLQSIGLSEATHGGTGPFVTSLKTFPSTILQSYSQGPFPQHSANCLLSFPALCPGGYPALSVNTSLQFIENGPGHGGDGLYVKSAFLPSKVQVA